MCQAFAGESRYVLKVEMEYGTYRAFLHGLGKMPDYCPEHGNYWCGCKPEQSDPAIKAERQRRRELPPIFHPVPVM